MSSFVQATATQTAAMVPQILLGRPFSLDELEAIREEIIVARPLNREEIANRVCKRLGWKSAGGQYQIMSAKVGLLRLHRTGLIALPPPMRKNGQGRRFRDHTVKMPEEKKVELPANKLRGLTLLPVASAEQSALYNELLKRYHYLGYTPLVGAQMRYFFSCDDGLLGIIGFGAAAWKLASRDSFIGWQPSVREKNLHLILNNARFLILPWVRSKNLASKVLGLCARRIPGDFLTSYGYTPVLLETFVQHGRFMGTCYRAANWIFVGQTKGRGKKHVYKTPGVAIKDIWLYPLRPNFRRVLQSAQR
jgi:Druantia protein DruA